MEAQDGRRALYVPIAVDIASGKTGMKLLGKFGHAGLLTWVCFLAACKRSINQGEFQYGSEEEGWRMLGLDYPITPNFTLQEFFTCTGHLKQTKRRRIGRLTHVTCTQWKDWNVSFKRQFDREEKSRKRAAFTSTLDRHYDDNAATIEKGSKRESEEKAFTDKARILEIRNTIEDSLREVV